MSKRVYLRFSLLAFYFVISLPMMVMLVSEKKQQSKVENRVLAKWPALPKDYQNLQQARSQLESYLEDHFGWRDHFIAANNKVKFKLFNELSSNRLTSGLDGYIFMNSHGKDDNLSMLKSVCGVTVPSDNSREEMRAGIKSFLSYHDNKGINTTVAIIPTKAKIYPEYLPEWLAGWCQGSKPTWIDDFAQSFGPGEVIYPLADFIDWKRSGPVYLPKHFHWNGTTPYWFAQQLFKFWNIEPELQPNTEQILISSDLNNHLSGLHFDDYSVSYEYSDNSLERCFTSECLPGLEAYYMRGEVFKYSRKSPHNNRLLLLSDSFGPGVMRHLFAGFQEVVAIELNQLKKDEEQNFLYWVSEAVQPTHMIYVMHDGGLIWQARRLNRVFN